MASPRFIPREGFHLDTLLDLTWLILKNPLFALPIIARILYPQSPYWHHLPFTVTSSVVVIYSALVLAGVLARLNAHFTTLTKNNAVRDPRWSRPDWSDELVLVTGASSRGGICHSVLVHLLASRPAEHCPRIAILDIAPPTWTSELEPDKQKLIRHWQCDLADLDATAAVFDQLTAELGGSPTILLNGAGLVHGHTLASPQTTPQSLNRSITVMLTAPLLLTHLVLPAMIAANHGHILSLASMSAYLPPPGIADYAAAKNGLVAAHDALRLELRRKAPAVRLSLFAPSFIRTPLLRGAPFKQGVVARFLAPVLQVDTVGEEICGVIEGGLGRDVFMPRVLLGWCSGIRGWPGWAANGLRDGVGGVDVDRVRRKAEERERERERG